MNYRHQYHAGNFADVFKHTVLIALLEALSKKEKPWCYIETHAGRGIYDLYSIEAQKTNEYQGGISKLFPGPTLDNIAPLSIDLLNVPVLQKYYQILEKTGYPNYYPGSPLIAYHCLRSLDNMILIEKQPEEVKILKSIFTREPSVESLSKKTGLELKSTSSSLIAVHLQDGYLGLKGFLPPVTRRGLILIDPPFEQPKEWLHIISALKMGLKKFASGVFAVWYPIKSTLEVKQFYKAIQNLNEELYPLSFNILITELCIYPEDVTGGLKGAGMVIVNPPWQIEQTLQELSEQLFHCLSINNQGRYEIRWLNAI